MRSTSVIYGTRAAQDWRQRLLDSTDQPLTAEQISRTFEAIATQVAKRDAKSAETDPAPSTLTRLYWTALGILAAVTGALLGNLNILTATHSWTAWAAISPPDSSHYGTPPGPSPTHGYSPWPPQ